MLDEYAKVFYNLINQANILQIEKELAQLPAKERIIEENRLQNLGYNIGQRHKKNDKDKLKRILGGNG